MATTELASGLHIHHFDTGPFNWYLLEQDSRLTLVDAGFPGHYQVFSAGIQSIGRTIKDVEAIVLTHAHADHIGFAEHLRSLTNAPVFVHQDDLAKAGHVLQLPWYGLLSNAWRPYIRTMLGHAISNGILRLPYVRKAYPFKDGALLDIPGKPHVLHVPGHTPGEVALYLPASKALLSGDTIVTRDLMTGEQGRPQVPHHLLNQNDKQARRSIDRLSELGHVTMFPGHGEAWTGSMSDAITLAGAHGTAN